MTTTIEDRPRKKLRSNDAADIVDWSLSKIHNGSSGYANFEPNTRENRILIDKTLLCKAFFGSKVSVISVSLPLVFCTRINLDILEKFFNILSSNDMQEPGRFLGSHGKPVPLDLETARANRSTLFDQTLLHEHLPSFFRQHFCRYPVIRISLAFSPYDCANPEKAYKRLIRNVLPTIYFWINSLDCNNLNDMQKERHKALSKIYSEGNEIMGSNYISQDIKSMLIRVFVCLSNFVTCISPEHYIVIVEDCDMPFIELQGKPWENEIRQMLLELLLKMFKNNDRLLKALLVGTYAFPLNELGLDSVVSINPAFDGCSQQQIGCPLTNEQAIASMFGYTASEVYEMAEKSNLNEQDKLLLDYYGGFDFGYNEVRFSSTQVISCLAEAKRSQGSQKFLARGTSFQTSRNKKLHLLKLFICKPHDTVNSIICKPSPELLMLVLRLVTDYDSGTSSCFIWSSAELKAEQCKNADDLLSNFAIDPSANPGNTIAESSLDTVVTLLVYLGYLTIRSNNVLCIPNSSMRDMWEKLRLLATFGTPVLVQQDIKQHQLIGSLYNGELDLLSAEFTSALQQLSNSSSKYSQQVKLEFMCRILLSKLSMPIYTYDYRRANIEYNVRFLVDPQFDKPWSVTLLPLGRYIQSLTVTFCFKRHSSLSVSKEQGEMDIASSHHSANAQHHLQLSLAVVIDQNNAAVLKHSE